MLIENGVLTDYMWDSLALYARKVERRRATVVARVTNTCPWCA